jgi:uncharacterized membrane protein HdeD (DUF308 family)
MSTPQGSAFGAFSLDARDLAKSTINSVRVALGVSGVVALIIGVLITFWPKNAAEFITILLGIYFVIAGLAYLGLGLFSKGISGGARAVDIILAVLFVIAGIMALSNISGTTTFLAVFLGILIGIIWIIEGIVTFVQLGDAASKGWAIFFAILSIIAGIVLLFSPLWGIVILFTLTGISLIILGIVQIVRAFTFGRGVTAAA